MPLEPIHIHIAEGTPTENGTKIADVEQSMDAMINNKRYISKELYDFVLGNLHRKGITQSKKLCRLISLGFKLYSGISDR